ncbi:MAG: hypothetical protein F4091_06500 [Acidimicrobiales bacterium]|nr:hypothetical protein [Acidimicrobiales bacterium]MYD83917.1 hypothetical protein [Acidimicrobiales bacterium]MYG62458.1 hypothetical protein [Acidimicrobiales bacterium]MYJ65103.1 hypothetical protein [Acidimicrobiales bacterium]
MLRQALRWKQPKPASWQERILYELARFATILIPLWILFVHIEPRAGTAWWGIVVFIAIAVATWMTFTVSWIAWVTHGRSRAHR